MLLVGGSERSHLSGFFQLFAPKFWEVTGPTTGTLSFYGCRLSGGDIQRWWETSSNPTGCNLICLNCLHSQAVGILKHILALFLAPEPLGETLTT